MKSEYWIRKKMYLDKEVYEEVRRSGISFDDIQREYSRMRMNGTPKASYNVACIMLINKRRGGS